LSQKQFIPDLRNCLLQKGISAGYARTNAGNYFTGITFQPTPISTPNSTPKVEDKDEDPGTLKKPTTPTITQQE
jgi:hypothetical protein